jgi:hypothetical protein
MEKEEKEKVKIEPETQELLRRSEISLILDTYEDIFSDFDPRPFSQRALSDDFLLAAKKASKELKTGIQLKFMIPKFLRNSSEESLIKKRLRDHFRKHADEKKKEREGILKQGLYFAISGIVLMFIASIILFQTSERSIISSFLVVFLEPAGWFLFWEGLNLVIFESKEKKPDLDFYEKMARCEVEFIDY